MSTRTNKKYKIIYDKISSHYNGKDFLSIPQACEKEGIATSTYYKICKALNRKSVAEKGRIEDEKKERRRERLSSQKGGNRTTVNTTQVNQTTVNTAPVENILENSTFIGGKSTMPSLPQTNENIKIRKERSVRTENL